MYLSSILRKTFQRSIILDINSYTLSFNNKALEQTFQNQYFRKSILFFRIAFIATIFIYASFGYFDNDIAKENYLDFYYIRYLVVIPLLLIVFIISFLKVFIKVWQEILAFCFVISGLGIIYMMLLSNNGIYYYGGMLLVIMAGYFFVKLRFIFASTSGILLVVLYNIGVYVFEIKYNHQTEYLLLINAFYISSNIISMIALYNIELLERIEFYQKILLLEKQEEISITNKKLEIKVAERTKLLNERNAKLICEIEYREKIESKLHIEKEKAEESNLLKTAFLNNMSHEIRTPLNGILGFIELLQNPELKDDEKDRYMEIINISSDRLIKTVRDIIDISKIEAGQVNITLTDVNINDMVMELYNFFLNQATIKGLELNISHSQYNKEVIIYTDEHKLNGVLTNLIKNSIKFTDKGEVNFGYNLTDDFIEFFVEDTGIGIADSKQKSIFNRFEQGDLDDSKAIQGSGLGLSISKAYVEMLGGRIWLNSKKNSGTNFHFTLPYKKAPTL